VSTTISTRTALLADAVGFEVKYITGYEGGADTTLAVIKGDGDMRLTSGPRGADDQER